MRRVVLTGACMASLLMLRTDLPWRTIVFEEPVDAVSALLADVTTTAAVSGWNGKQWTAWEMLHGEDEQDPLLRESNLLLFEEPVTALRIRGDHFEALHPIRIAGDPLRYTLAAHGETEGMTAPKILSRHDWGADESLTVAHPENTEEESQTEEKQADNGGGGTPAQRIIDCENARKNYSQEFRPAKTVRKLPSGEKLLWQLQYSKDIRLLVVHHTAMMVGGDERPAVERVRALYEYHAKSRGWGDVGYHYLIDEEGKIYQGRKGGDSVVGGHVYCGNIGTIGVALLGNFEIEQPSLPQIQSLQWLLDDLAKLYDLDPSATVLFHGKELPVIVRHKDLVSTDCPGYYMSSVIGQVRTHVAEGNLDAAVRFPVIAKEKEKPKATITERSRGVSRRIATLTRKIRRSDRLAGRSGRTYARPTQNRPQPLRPVKRSSSVSSEPVLSSVEGSSVSSESYRRIRIRLTREDKNLRSCADADITTLENRFRGSVECIEISGTPAIINALSLEDYLLGLAEEPDSEPPEKQKAFAIAARTYAAYYSDPEHRKFPGMPYDGSDDPAIFQAYGGRAFEERNPAWVRGARETAGDVLTVNGQLIKAAYFSSDDGRTRSPAEAGWSDFPFPEVFASKPDPWCEGMPLAGHGVGMSGCGAGTQAREGKTAQAILKYYYPGTEIIDLGTAAP